jgi:ferredoxin
MAKAKRVQSIFFSPTSTTQKILSTIAEHTGLPPANNIDLTLPHQRDTFAGKVEGEIILVGSPVYHGSPPWPMMDPLNRIIGEGKWAIPVAVYGNRSAETCVEEMVKILRGRGFKILAGASFVAEHSWASKSHPYALGRPDQNDLKTAADFGEQIRKKLSSDPSEIQTSGLLRDWFSKEMVESFPDGYHRREVETAKGLGWVVFSKDASCTGCMSCVNACPTSAMRIDPQEVDDGLCIRCMACTRTCPEGVLSLHYDDSPSSLERFERLGKVFAVRKEPVIYI